MALADCNINIACLLLNLNPDKIAALFTTCDEYLEFYKFNPLLATIVFTVNPSTIGDLFSTYEQYSHLNKLFEKNDNQKLLLTLTKGISIIEALYEKNRAQIGKLFSSSDRLRGLPSELQYKISIDQNINNANYDQQGPLKLAPGEVIELLSHPEQFFALFYADRLGTLAKNVFEHNPDKVIALFTTPQQFIVFSAIYWNLASDAIADNSEKILLLFTAAEQFIALVHASSSAAILAVDRMPQKVAALFTNPEAFIALIAIDPYAGYQIFEANPKEIAKLISTYEQYINLVKAYYKVYATNPSVFMTSSGLSIVEALYNHNPDKMGALFDTADKLQSLADLNLALAQKISKQQNIPLQQISQTEDLAFYTECQGEEKVSDKIISEQRLSEKGLTIDDFLKLASSSHSQALEKYNLNQNQILDLFSTSNQFIALAKANPGLASYMSLFNKNKFARLFNNSEEIIALIECKGSLADIFQDKLDQIIELFYNDKKFLALVDVSPKLALQAFNHNPERVGNLFSTYEQYLELAKKSNSDTIVEALFDKQQTKIGALFNTSEKLMALAAKNFKLAQKISKIHNIHIEQPVPQPESTIQHFRNSIINSSDSKQTASEATQVNINSPKNSSCSSIQLIVLGGFMAVAGVTLTLLAFTFLQAGACIAGIVVGGGLAIKGFGLFAKGYQSTPTHVSTNGNGISIKVAEIVENGPRCHTLRRGDSGVTGIRSIYGARFG